MGAVFLVVTFVFALYGLSCLQKEPNEQANVSQTSEAYKGEFIQKIQQMAIENGKNFGILPSIIIGQAILESDFGQSQLAKQYNNLFGVKAYGDVPKIALDTKEYQEGHWITIKGEFRIYNSWQESIDAHSQLFVNGVDWNPNLYEGIFTAKDYKEAASALQLAGYATDPNYAEKLIRIIEEFDLQEYDVRE